MIHPQRAAISSNLLPSTEGDCSWNDLGRTVLRCGRGGIGEVYRADDLRLRQTVVMKFLPAVLAQNGAASPRSSAWLGRFLMLTLAKRFRSEVEFAARSRFSTKGLALIQPIFLTFIDCGKFVRAKSRHLSDQTRWPVRTSTNPRI
jgi:serine/threonine protein kinase